MVKTTQEQKDRACDMGDDESRAREARGARCGRGLPRRLRAGMAARADLVDLLRREALQLRKELADAQQLHVERRRAARHRLRRRPERVVASDGRTASRVARRRRLRLGRRGRRLLALGTRGALVGAGRGRAL